MPSFYHEMAFLQLGPNWCLHTVSTFVSKWDRHDVVEKVSRSTEKSSINTSIVFLIIVWEEDCLLTSLVRARGAFA
ncbi:hypothetical protein Tco_0940389 [Tanacetum coccineum]|uniref:Uncharacterized protein n=1 Tax=Tanacetum coccineum TaxID=301880 RepID=A0ABQ5DUL1_9ASTR